MSAQLNVGSAGYPPSSTYSNQPETRSPEVSREMERLTRECEALNKNLDELETKLLTVLSIPKAVEGGSQSAPEPVRVPLAQGIYDRAQHLSRVNDQLQSIINRIEV